VWASHVVARSFAGDGNRGEFHPVTDEFESDTAPGATRFDEAGAH